MRHDLTDQRTDGARLQGVAGFFEWIACGAVRQGLLEAAKRHRMQRAHQRHAARGSYHHLRKALRGRHLRAIGNLNTQKSRSAGVAASAKRKPQALS